MSSQEPRPSHTPQPCQPEIARLVLPISRKPPARVPPLTLRRPPGLQTRRCAPGRFHAAACSSPPRSAPAAPE
eukprot:scaffold13307_cov97-Isochrysis_galbana.AAC.9